MVATFLMLSCSEDKYSACRVNIRLLAPEGYSDFPLEKMTVTLASRSHGAIYQSACSSDGVASFEVECGYYTVSAHYQTPAGLIFSGRIESLALLSEVNEKTKTVELPLLRSETSALVIKEIYYAGCIGRQGEEYQADQYVTIYNNSEEVLYLDGLCVAVVDPAGSNESPWMKYTDMDKIPVNDLAWQFPGRGRDYPLYPGDETTIATNAVDHTGGDYLHANSVNLSGVDFGFWDVSLSRQDIQAGVVPMKLISRLNPNTSLYSFPLVGPAFMIFSLQTASALEYVENPQNRKPRPQAANQNKMYLMIPKEWVIDCVECVESLDRITVKRVPDGLNHTPAFIPEGAYSGKSLVRKKTVDAKGRVLYQDTNDASQDFEVTTPLLKK